MFSGLAGQDVDGARLQGVRYPDPLFVVRSPKPHRRRRQQRHSNDDSKLRFVLVPTDSCASAIFIDTHLPKGILLAARLRRSSTNEGISSALRTDRRLKSYLSPKWTTLRFPR